LIAGVPVSDLDTSTRWYRRYFGREPDLIVGDDAIAALGLLTRLGNREREFRESFVSTGCL
jgi:hypothetical protein